MAPGLGAACLQLPTQPLASARNVQPRHPPAFDINPQPTSIIGPANFDDAAASEEDILGPDLTPLDPNTLVVSAPLVAKLMAGDLGPGNMLAQGQRRASSVRSRASSSYSRRSTSSRCRVASHSQSVSIKKYKLVLCSQAIINIKSIY
ncbi:hypothetical protein GDO81_014191 [Engystomops pustulosus]|uniref:Uncharacterized protein n=1 Tax=Engystomops pustulosus TaxID=76066 RepID=A0AAV7B8Q3_ENGPU|nr:hypothetical protein GDO81_014191 [Engystomops pustulosus]